MLQRGDQVPHFTVMSLDGGEAVYSRLWQRKNLLLVLLPDEESAAATEYVAALEREKPELTANDTACVVTRARVPEAPAPAVLVADKWGEIYFATNAEGVEDLPPVSELVEWLRYVQHECPECQAEAR